MNSGIYKIANKVTGDFYIGSTKNFEKRFKEHVSSLKNKRHVNTILQKVHNKYGIEKLSFDIIDTVKDLNQLESREQYYLDTLQPKYNIRVTANSNLGLKFSDEHKYKIGLANKGKTRSKEQKKTLSEALKGREVWNKGVKTGPLSLKTRQKLSKAHKNIPRGPMLEETKRKLSDINKGKKLSEETKKKISKSLKNHYKNHE